MIWGDLSSAPLELAIQQPAACAKLLRPLAAGTIIAKSDLEPASCLPVAAAFRYDRAAGLARARRDLAVGEIVPSLPASMMAPVSAGSVVHMRAHVGPVVVERSVLVVRPGRAGRPMLVQAGSGGVFVAPSVGVAP